MPLVGKKKGSSNAGTGCLATTSPPMVPEICAFAVPASAENPAAVARIATIAPSLDVYIGSPSVDVRATNDAGDGGGIPGRDGSLWPAEPREDGRPPPVVTTIGRVSVSHKMGSLSTGAGCRRYSPRDVLEPGSAPSRRDGWTRRTASTF